MEANEDAVSELDRLRALEAEWEAHEERRRRMLFAVMEFQLALTLVLDKADDVRHTILS